MGWWRMTSLSSLSSPPAIIMLVMLCSIIRVSSSSSSSSSSSKPISSRSSAGGVGVGYEYVGTVYLDQDPISWSAPCFKENSAILILKNAGYDARINYYTVIVTPQYGQCWTCRDDYQFKLGDKNVDTGSTYFGGVGNDFTLSIRTTEEEDQLKNEGIHIYVDMNGACNGISRRDDDSVRRIADSIAMN